MVDITLKYFLAILDGWNFQFENYTDWRWRDYIFNHLKWNSLFRPQKSHQHLLWIISIFLDFDRVSKWAIFSKFLVRTILWHYFIINWFVIQLWQASSSCSGQRRWWHKEWNSHWYVTGHALTCGRDFKPKNLVNFIKGHLLFASVASTYIVLAIKLLEEPGLRRKIGPQYEKYMETTPAFCPFLTMGKSKSVEKKDW